MFLNVVFSPAVNLAGEEGRVVRVQAKYAMYTNTTMHCTRVQQGGEGLEKGLPQASQALHQANNAALEVYVITNASGLSIGGLGPEI